MDRFHDKKVYAAITPVIMLVIGLILLIKPEDIYSLILNVAGIGLLIGGGIRCVLYFMNDARTAMDNRYLTTGASGVICGIVMLTCKGVLITIVPMLLGLAITVGGFTRLQGALDMRRLGTDNKAMIITSAVAVVLGLVFIFFPFTSAIIMGRLLGAALIFEAVNQGIFGFRFNKFMNDNMKGSL